MAAWQHGSMQRRKLQQNASAYVRALARLPPRALAVYTALASLYKT